MTTETPLKVLPVNPKDQTAEELLASHDLDWQTETIALTQIDKPASLRNQARITPLSHENVELYAAAIERGDTFPPVIVSREETGFVVIDGNHRLAAAETAGFEAVTALIVLSASRAEKELLTYEANTRHGIPTSQDERITQGLYLVEIGNPVVQVARLLGIPESRFTQEVAMARLLRRLSNLGVKRAEMLSRGVRSRLSALRNDPVLKAVAELAISTQFNTVTASQIVTEINKRESEGAQLAYVAEAREELLPIMRSTAGGRLRLPIHVFRTQMATRFINNIDLDAARAQAAAIDPTLRSQLAQKAIESANKLLAMAALLKSNHGA